jgi:hypothetical protein
MGLSIYMQVARKMVEHLHPGQNSSWSVGLVRIRKGKKENKKNKNEITFSYS